MRKPVKSSTLIGSLLFASAVQAQTFIEVFVDNTNHPLTSELHDFNRDGNLDILAFDFQIVSGARSNPTIIYQFTGNGDGTFTLLDTKNFSHLDDHQVADFNADGFLDLLWGDFAYPGTADGRFSNCPEKFF